MNIARFAPKSTRSVAAISFAGLAIACPLAAAQDDAVVQMKDDPFRRLALENAAVRVWGVHVPVGQSSPFHEHKLDMVNVRINSTEVTNFPKGGLFSFTSDMRCACATNTNAPPLD